MLEGGRFPVWVSEHFVYCFVIGFLVNLGLLNPISMLDFYKEVGGCIVTK